MIFNFGKILILSTTLGGLILTSSSAFNRAFAQVKKKKVIYKKYTEFNFSGETVQGKARTPELFYIFQRKRSEGHRLLTAPTSFSFRNPATAKSVKEELKP